MLKEKAQNLITSFAGSFGLSSSVFSGFDFKRWEFILYSLLAATIASISYYVVLFLEKKKLQNFFGLNNHTPANIAIGSYWNLKEYDESAGEDANIRYYKHDGNSSKKRFLVGAIQHPLTDVGVASEAIQLATHITRTGSYKINLFGDENIPTAIDGPIFCLGSPTSNSTTKIVFDRLPASLNVQFTTKTLSSWIHETEFSSTSSIDYGLLLRYTINKKVYFVCAGIDEHGTIALSKLLLSKWKSLPQEDFIHIYKIDKNDCDVIERISGKTKHKDGTWVSS